MDYITPDEAREELLQEFSELYELKGVEIFRTGQWKGHKFENADLDAIVDAYPRQGYRPPVKLGHAEKSGAPAYGWVDSIRREGDKLVADLVDLPETLYNAIKDKRYNAVSSEIYNNIERGGEKFARALKAVALLGAEIPAVSSLRPLEDSFSDNESEAFEFNIENTDEEAQTMSEIKLEDAQVDELRARVHELEAKLAEFSQEDETQEDEDPRVVELSQQVAELQAREQARIIKDEASRCTVPAYAETVEQLFSVAYSSVLKFSDDQTAVDVVRSLVEKLNGDASKMLTEFSTDETTGTIDEDDIPAGELVEKRAKEYAREHQLSFSDSLHAVLAADPELAKRYAEE